MPNSSVQRELNVPASFRLRFNCGGQVRPRLGALRKTETAAGVPSSAFRVPRFPCALLLSAIVAAAVSAFPVRATAEESPAGQQVRAAILRSIDALRHQQKPDGTWPEYAQEHGVTALATYALLAAGAAPDDKPMLAGLDVLLRTKNDAVYVVSLKTLALASADPVRYKTEIQASADWLVEKQTATGAWGYGMSQAPGLLAPAATPSVPRASAKAAAHPAAERPDGSNTQFAVLALAEAERVGARVPIDVWRKVDRYFRSTQLPGGGWGYVYHDPEPSEAYGSMTTAAVASLYLAHERLAPEDTPETTADRMAAIDRGLDWLGQHYSLKENPQRDLAWYYFWLWGVERVGVISGRRTFGSHDWFREGTALLVAGQRADGTWTDKPYHDALCLLFLAKGYRPLLIQRLRWQGDWRPDSRDLAGLVRFLGKRIGSDPVAWRVLDSGAPLADYLAAPILHLTGRGPVRMLAADATRLKEYVQQGGLLLVDPQGGDAAFTDSVRKLLLAQFPDSKFEPLPADHPIATLVHRVKPGALEVMNVGCRASIVLAPGGLSDGWADAAPATASAATGSSAAGSSATGTSTTAAAPPATDALQLGENLAVYATRTAPLPDRLATATVLTMPPETVPPGDATRIGQIQHDGDWQPRPYALPALIKDVADQYGVPIASRPAPVRLTDPTLGKYNILYITGHYTFHLTEAEKKALRGYLDRGGFLWAEACCGRPAFDKALRDLAKELYPDTALKELPLNHPIFAGGIAGRGDRIETVAYSPAVKAESPDLDRPVLFGLERGGHLVLVYSPYGLAAGLDGLKTYGARTVAPEDARRLATNILLYAAGEH
jgi:hypothetical protein